MKRQYIAPETLITFVEAISDFAHLSGYAIDNGVDICREFIAGFLGVIIILSWSLQDLANTSTVLIKNLNQHETNHLSAFSCI